MFAVAIVLVLALLAAALGGAPAWGPGLHIHFTIALVERLRQRKRLRPAEELVLEQHDAFLYGNIAADIINFKAYGGVKNHCHNWNIHERLERETRTPEDGAFVLGFLCHLAADIVAHNHFVPYSLVASFPPRFLGHAYWEAIADARVTDAEWHTIDRLKRKHMHVFDLMVHRAVPHRALGVRSNRWIFNNILLLSCRRRWRELVRLHSQVVVQHPLDLTFLRRCMEQSVANMVAVFSAEQLALLKARDPTGRSAFAGARALRRELRRDSGTLAAASRDSGRLAHQAFGISRR